MKKTTTKIKINNGYLVVVSDGQILRESKCSKCGQQIHKLQTMIKGSEAVEISKDIDGFINHSLVCPAVLKAIKKEKAKEYRKERKQRRKRK